MRLPLPVRLGRTRRKCKLVNATHVDAPLLGAGLLAPPELGRLALPKSEHAELLANPARYALHESDLEIASGCLEIDVRARDEVAQDGDRLRGVERVAECRPEGPLTCMEAGAKGHVKTDQHTTNHEVTDSRRASPAFPASREGEDGEGKAPSSKERKSYEDQIYLSVRSRSACWKRFLPSREGPSASAWETSALTFVKKFCGEAPRGAGQHRRATDGACMQTRACGPCSAARTARAKAQK